MSQITEAMIEAGCRAVYADWPHKAFSQALVEATGKPLNAVLTYDEAKALGMTEDGLRRMLTAAYPAMSSASPPVEQSEGVVSLAQVEALANEYMRGQDGPGLEPLGAWIRRRLDAALTPPPVPEEVKR